MKRTLSSVSGLADYLNDNLKRNTQIPRIYGKYMAEYVSTFTVVMKTSRGRDKICSIFQYIAQFYYACNKYSAFEEVRQRVLERLSVSAQVALNAKDSMKSARKIFKFLKFIDEILALYNIMESKKPIYMKILKFLAHLVSFFHNLIDNLLWGFNIGVLNFLIDKKTYKQWKAKKHITSLIRIIMKALYYNFSFQIRSKQVKNILIQLRPYQRQPIKEDSLAYELSLKYLKQRYELRIEMLDSVVMALRVIMLVRRLKLPGRKYVTSILHATCGVLSTLLSAIKMLIEQPKLIELKDRSDKLSKSESMELISAKNLSQPVQRIKISTVDISLREQDDQGNASDSGNKNIKRMK